MGPRSVITPSCGADAKATTVHGPGLAIRVRRNGSSDEGGVNVKVLSWVKPG